MNPNSCSLSSTTWSSSSNSCQTGQFFLPAQLLILAPCLWRNSWTTQPLQALWHTALMCCTRGRPLTNRDPQATCSGNVISSSCFTVRFLVSTWCGNPTSPASSKLGLHQTHLTDRLLRSRCQSTRVRDMHGVGLLVTLCVT